VLSFWISVFAAAELAVFITVTGNWSFPADALGWGMTAVLAVSADVLALVLFQAGLRSVGGVAASLLSTFEPVTGLLVGVIVFREALTVLSVIAVALILASVVILLAKKESNN
jgi:drug/metabolite transporter (DMT)-like permease